MCRYSAAHIWWSGVLMFLIRSGSRNTFDQSRNTGHCALNMGELCGQRADDPRFDGKALITCTDNLAHHLGRIGPEKVQKIPIEMCELLIKRRVFDDSRLFGAHYLLIFDGTVQERCRTHFRTGGKSSGGTSKRYRYVLQCGLIGPGGTFFPLMHEHMDMRNPITEKEDCELNAFTRLAKRVKERFPRLSFCIVGDALYGVAPVASLCRSYHWKYVLALKEGRQPTLWGELLELLPDSKHNHVRVRTGQDGKEGLRDFRWVENLNMGGETCHAVLSGEITSSSATLYAYVTNMMVTRDRVVEMISRSGRERHLIEDYFNQGKNHGVGLGHVFCAAANASKNLFTLMQIAQILWTLICHGYLVRVFDWAARATQRALARAIGEGLRSSVLPVVLPQPGQLRFPS